MSSNRAKALKLGLPRNLVEKIEKKNLSLRIRAALIEFFKNPTFHHEINYSDCVLKNVYVWVPHIQALDEVKIKYGFQRNQIVAHALHMFMQPKQCPNCGYQLDGN